MVLIVDVSHWQPPNVPWGNLYADGVRAMLSQLSRGLGLQIGAYEHLTMAHTAGLLTGFYHWLTPGDDPAEQARVFVSLIPRDWRGRLAVDVEEDGVTDAMLMAFLDAFDAEHLAHSFPLIIYTRKNWWDPNIGSAHDYRYRRFELWAAGGPGYDQPERQPPPGYAAPIPYPWTDAVLEQFTGKGQLPGYSGDLDISLARLTEAEFVAWWTLDYVTLWNLLGALPMPISDADAKTVADGLSKIMLTITQLLPLLHPAPPPPPPPPPPPANWWDAWPSGLIIPPRRLPAPPAPITIYGPDGQPFAPAGRRQNAMDVYERQGDLLRVTDAPIFGSLWWVKAEDLLAPAPAAAVG